MKTEAILKELNDITNRIEVIKKQIEKPENVSGWYKSSRHNEWLVCYDFENKLIYGFIFGTGKWFHRELSSVRPDDDDYLATPTEVQQALEKEAVKRGFKVGSKVKYIGGQSTGIIVSGYENEFRESDNEFYFNNILVFEKGVWAEIIHTLTIDDIASKLIGLDLEDTKSELIRMKTQIIETLNNL